MVKEISEMPTKVHQIYEGEDSWCIQYVTDEGLEIHDIPKNIKNDLEIRKKYKPEDIKEKPEPVVFQKTVTVEERLIELEKKILSMENKDVETIA